MTQNAEPGAVIWYWESEQAWVVSVRPAGFPYEGDLGKFPNPHEAIGHLNRWADQRGQVVIPQAVWGDGINYFDLRPLPPERQVGG